MVDLKSILAQEDTVLFVGSGVSMWSGLPSWAQLIEQLATFLEATGPNADLVRAEARRGDFLQAASYALYNLTQTQIGAFMRTACRYGAARPHEIHRALVTLGPRCYVTTNYDTLLEESLRGIMVAGYITSKFHPSDKGSGCENPGKPGTDGTYYRPQHQSWGYVPSVPEFCRRRLPPAPH